MIPKFAQLHPDAVLPTRANPSDSGMDLYAIEDTILLPGVPTLVRTGLAVVLPSGGDLMLVQTSKKHKVSGGNAKLKDVDWGFDPIGTRIYNRMRFHFSESTVQDLVEHGIDDRSLSRIKDLGKKSFQRIREVLKKYCETDMECVGGYEAYPVTIEAQIRPRSGLALKHGVTVLNAPGTVDNLYRGEIKGIMLWNGHGPNCRHYFINWPWPGGEHSEDRWLDCIDDLVNDRDDNYEKLGLKKPCYAEGTELRGYKIRKGDRFAQLVLQTVLLGEPVWGEMDATTRGDKGFGSSGK